MVLSDKIPHKNWFCQLFSESSNGVPAMLPVTLLSRQAGELQDKNFEEYLCMRYFVT